MVVTTNCCLVCGKPLDSAFRCVDRCSWGENDRLRARAESAEAKLKVAVEALESIMDGRAWKTRTDHINLTPRQLSGIAEDALAKIGGDDE